jgi:hypothetical protein
MAGALTTTWAGGVAGDRGTPRRDTCTRTPLRLPMPGGRLAVSSVACGAEEDVDTVTGRGSVMSPNSTATTASGSFTGTFVAGSKGGVGRRSKGGGGEEEQRRRRGGGTVMRVGWPGLGGSDHGCWQHVMGTTVTHTPHPTSKPPTATSGSGTLGSH